MAESSDLSRRERQIMEAVFALGEATVNQVVEAIRLRLTPRRIRKFLRQRSAGLDFVER